MKIVYYWKMCENSPPFFFLHQIFVMRTVKNPTLPVFFNLMFRFRNIFFFSICQSHLRSVKIGLTFLALYFDFYFGFLFSSRMGRSCVYITRAQGKLNRVYRMLWAWRRGSSVMGQSGWGEIHTYRAREIAGERKIVRWKKDSHWFIIRGCNSARYGCIKNSKDFFLPPTLEINQTKQFFSSTLVTRVEGGKLFR